MRDALAELRAAARALFEPLHPTNLVYALASMLDAISGRR